jgi:hypothetical protein
MKPERGKGLEFLLAYSGWTPISVILHSLVAIKWLGVQTGDEDGPPVAAGQKLMVFAVLLGLVQLGATFGIWKWKKLGVYAYAAANALMFFVALRGAAYWDNPYWPGRTRPPIFVVHGADVSYGIAVLMWMGMVAAFALPKWSAFED